MHPQPATLHPKPGYPTTLNPQPSTLNPTTLHPQPSTKPGYEPVDIVVASSLEIRLPAGGILANKPGLEIEVRLQAKMQQLERVWPLKPESKGHNLAVLHVLGSLSLGRHYCERTPGSRLR